jgi:predicted ABC-type ATPase
MPDLYIITGSNGAGKSSVGPTYLPEHIRNNFEVFNGDVLFVQRRAELWQQGIRAIKESKRLAMEFVECQFDALVANALSNRADFVYEGHFPNEATWDVPQKFKAEGYKINMIFMGLADTELSAFRVLTRAKEGGHNVDPLSLRDNFYGNLEKVDKYFKVLNSLLIVDASETEHTFVALFKDGKASKATSYNQLPTWVKNYMPTIAQTIKNYDKAF